MVPRAIELADRLACSGLRASAAVYSPGPGVASRAGANRSFEPPNAADGPTLRWLSAPKLERSVAVWSLVAGASAPRADRGVTSLPRVVSRFVVPNVPPCSLLNDLFEPMVL